MAELYGFDHHPDGSRIALGKPGMMGETFRGWILDELERRDRS